MSVSPVNNSSSDPYNSNPGDVLNSYLTFNNSSTDLNSSSSTTSSSSIPPVQAEYLTLQQQDTAELLYASFLSPTAGLENADEVLQQAATLFPTPGTLPSTSDTSATTSSSTSTSPADSSSSSSPTDPLESLPSVSTLLAQSDQTAQQTLSAYANAPTGSSIIDYQA